MSYILEALKRAEKERKLGQTPAALDEIAVPQVGAGQARRRWVLIGAGAVLLVAAIVYGAVALFHHQSPSAPDSAAGPTAYVPGAVETTAAPTPAVESVPSAEENAAAATLSPDTPTAAADAKIEGGEAIASLDDLTGDSPTGAAAPDAESAMENDPENDDDAPQAAGVEASSAANTPSTTPTPSPKQALQVAPKPVPTLPATQPEVVTAKAPTSKPGNRPAVPAPAQRAAVPPPQVLIPREPRAPPAGPLVVLGQEPQVIEAVDSAPAATVSNAAASTPTIGDEPPAPVAAGDSAPPSATKPPALAERSNKAARATGKALPAPGGESAAIARDRAERIDSLRRFKEMPPAYRAEFPPLTVDVHVYNADANRSFVIVGGKRYRAGDTLAEGPRIDEIVSEGIVFEWRNEKILYALGR